MIFPHLTFLSVANMDMSFGMWHGGPDEIRKACGDKNHSGMNPDTSCQLTDVTELEATLLGGSDSAGLSQMCRKRLGPPC